MKNQDMVKKSGQIRTKIKKIRKIRKIRTSGTPAIMLKKLSLSKKVVKLLLVQLKKVVKLLSFYQYIVYSIIAMFRCF